MSVFEFIVCVCVYECVCVCACACVMTQDGWLSRGAPLRGWHSGKVSYLPSPSLSPALCLCANASRLCRGTFSGCDFIRVSG